MVSPLSGTELCELAAEWQKRLRLQDWRVKVKYVRMCEMSDRDDRNGECLWNIAAKSATIRVLLPEHRNVSSGPAGVNDDEYATDEEMTLVHELVHLHLADWWDTNGTDDLHKRALENAVYALSEALVLAKREGH